MSVHEFDFCVLGAGSAGFAAATTARILGKSVALADGTGPLSGLCILRGCMPSKTILRSAEVAHIAGTASELGIHVDGVRPDVKAVIERKRRIIKDFADYRVEALETQQKLTHNDIGDIKSSLARMEQKEDDLVMWMRNLTSKDHR